VWRYRGCERNKKKLAEVVAKLNAEGYVELSGFEGLI